VTSTATNQFSLPDDVDPRMMSRPEFAELAPVVVFPGVTSHLDLTYAGPVGFRPLTLDMHLPQRPVRTPVPVVIYAHPGGFLAGSKRMGPWRFLLDAGIAVASISYRLGGESVFPTAVHDVAAAVRWVRAHADEYGVDAETIVGFGCSAGAYLMSAVALAGDSSTLVGRIGPVPDVSCRLAAVIEHYGISDLLTIDQDVPPEVVELMDRPDSSISRFLGYVPSSRPEVAAQTNLCLYAQAASPPFLIAHGDQDRRVGINQSRRLHQALTQAGARSELIEIAGGDHGSAHFDEPPLHETTLTFLRSVLNLPATTPPLR
jgi:acetyl esterase/lipase